MHGNECRSVRQELQVLLVLLRREREKRQDRAPVHPAPTTMAAKCDRNAVRVLSKVHQFLHAFAVGGLGAALGVSLAAGIEKAPELEVFVTTDRSQRGAVGTHAAAEDASIVGRDDLAGLLERGVVEERDVIGREPVCGHDFHPGAAGVSPVERQDLRLGLDGIHPGPRGGVPEVDGLVSGATAAGEQRLLVRAPQKGLDGCSVVGLGEHWFAAGRPVALAGVPHTHDVVVPAAG